MKNSNISCISNIYPIKDSVYEDKEFIKHIKGKKSLEKILKCTDIKINQLTEIQQTILKNDVPCILADKEENVWGPIMTKEGILKWQCRCEKVECKHFRECIPHYNKK